MNSWIDRWCSGFETMRPPSEIIITTSNPEELKFFEAMASKGLEGEISALDRKFYVSNIAWSMQAGKLCAAIKLQELVTP